MPHMRLLEALVAAAPGVVGLADRAGTAGAVAHTQARAAVYPPGLKSSR